MNPFWGEYSPTEKNLRGPGGGSAGIHAVRSTPPKPETWPVGSFPNSTGAQVMALLVRAMAYGRSGAASMGLNRSKGSRSAQLRVVLACALAFVYLLVSYRTLALRERTACGVRKQREGGPANF